MFLEPAGRPEFLAGPSGELFVMEYLPAGELLGQVVFCPPFGEEMNRARRMIALQGNLLCNAGFSVIVPDLFGTGDSEGEFQQASWERWLDDLRFLVETRTTSQSNLWLWGLRTGCLLALDCVQRNRLRVEGTILWSPCVSGKVFVSRFLRMRRMAQLIVAGGAGESVADLRQRLDSGESIEVAGYDLNADMVAALDGLSLNELLDADAGTIHWFELSSSGKQAFPAEAERIVERAMAQDRRIEKHMLSGPMFWATPEISTAPELLQATERVFLGELKKKHGA